MKRSISKTWMPLLILLFYLMISWIIWNVELGSVVLFISLIPLFFGLEILRNSTKKRILKLVGFIAGFKVVWLLGQIAWLREVTFDTYLAAIISHTILFTVLQIPSIYSFYKKTNNSAYYLFVFSWIIYEYACQNFGLLSPFIILGTTLSEYTFLIQNYQWFGIEGGSLWILFFNLSLFLLIQTMKRNRKAIRKQIIVVSIVAIVPLIFSAIVWFSPIHSDKKMKVAALHTFFNISDIRYSLNPNVIIDSLWNLSKGVDKDAEVLLWPETVVANMGWIEELHQNTTVDSLQNRLKSFPKLNLTFGSNLFEYSKSGEDKRLNYSKEQNFYFYEYNIAFTLSSDRALVMRSKDIFVPFQEQIPFVQTFPFLKNLVTVVGNPSYYTSYEKDLDAHKTIGGAVYTPLLCYEICYPMYTSEVAKENGFTAVLGNEYWNKSKRGSVIYYNIVKSMAVQNASPLVKSSNNGISVVLDQKGRVLAQKSFEDTGLLQAEIQLKTDENFYTYIKGYSYLLALIMLPVLFFRKEKKTE
jgi:apolipoprotein N-acyltransferase